MNTTTLSFSETTNGSTRKRFIDYVVSRKTSDKTSAQTVQFDTITGQACFASDLFFKPEELKFW